MKEHNTTTLSGQDGAEQAVILGLIGELVDVYFVEGDVYSGKELFRPSLIHDMIREHLYIEIETPTIEGLLPDDIVKVEWEGAFGLGCSKVMDFRTYLKRYFDLSEYPSIHLISRNKKGIKL